MTSSRGSSEIIFMALLVLVVVGVGSLAVTSTSDIIGDTGSELNPPQFSLSDTEPITFDYTGDRTIQAQRTKYIYMVYPSDVDTVETDGYNVYPDKMISIEPGDTIYNRSQDPNNEFGYGDTVDFVWVTENGDREVVDSIFIPTENTTGTSISRGGSESYNGTTIVIEEDP